MFAVIFALFIVGLIVLSAELLWKLGLLRREAGRKYIHIMSGLWVAMWPLFLNLRNITFLSAVLLVGVVLTRFLHIGKSIRTIDRLSSGDILFPLGIALSALVTKSGWVFSIAVLHIGLADGLAGLLGSHFKVGMYKIFGQYKSALGSVVFVFTSLAILLVVFSYGPIDLASIALLPALISIPVFTAFAENLSPYGLDNITVPLVTVFLLNVLA